jgi:hypothetical protein
MVTDASALEFGDNDEGKILDLEGGDICHYRYLLQLCSLVLGERFEAFDTVSETVEWLFDAEAIRCIKAAGQVRFTDSRTFQEGGYTFLRSSDGRTVVGIDHAPLGFGSIAAHGHADALSFQLYVDGKCILGDPGTYIYHCNLPKRNAYRMGCNHNTVWMQHAEQSQMMGAFLWGKKADTKLIFREFTDTQDCLKAECRWQNGVLHRREFLFDKERGLEIHDSLQATEGGFATLMLHPDCRVELQEGNIACIMSGGTEVKIACSSAPRLEKAWYSTEYGVEKETQKLVFALNNNELKTKIWIVKY